MFKEFFGVPAFWMMFSWVDPFFKIMLAASIQILCIYVKLPIDTFINTIIYILKKVRKNT